MILIDLTHTSHTRARTGVQRVSRSLFEAAQKQIPTQALTHDRFEGTWRSLRNWELANLRSTSPAEGRGAKWPWPQRWLSRFHRFAGSTHSIPEASQGLIVPEIFSAATAAAFPALFERIKGPKIALFHDAIALKFPELTPFKTVARFPSYLQELRIFNGVAAVSEDSRQTLLDYWRWLGVSDHPPVRTIALGSPEPSKRTADPSRAIAKPVVLSVGSIEGRKNHLALLEACELLWKKGQAFQLQLIGLCHPETGRAAREKISALQQSGFDLRYEGAVSDVALDDAYRACSFTVYPSLMEGFGLPVLESLSHGKPCICSAQGALGEAALGGGCLTCDSVDTLCLSRSIETLLVDSALGTQLSVEARARHFRSWDSYAADLISWTDELKGAHPLGKTR